MPKKLASQFILLILFTLVATQLLIFSIFIYETDQNNIITKRLNSDHYYLRMASILKVAESTSSPEYVHSLNTYRVRFFLYSSPLFDIEGSTEHDLIRTEELKKYIGEEYKEVHYRQFKPLDHRYLAALTYLKDKVFGTSAKNLKKDNRRVLVQMQVKLHNGNWVGLTVFDLHVFPVWIRSTFQPMLIFTLLFSIFSVFIIKRITRPLAELADKATLLGKGQAIDPIQPRGPEDVQDTIVAFNTMMKRLLNVNDHRARALAAISHDIRTPLTSMRLNAEFITEKDIQSAMLDKIDEMEKICEATVTFALKDSWSEENKTFDITSLLESLSCDLCALGLDVSFNHTEKIPFRGRPVALKRAFTNLIKNAVKYGKRAEISIVTLKNSIEIHIQDEGEGIKDVDPELLFEPFERSEESRNRKSGGLGLGLAIARSVVRSHGGEITLVNGEELGLDAVVTLPL